MKHLIKFLILPLFFLGKVDAQIKNLGPNINSIHQEIRPIITVDGKTMFFTIEGDPQNPYKDGQSIWTSEKDEDGKWKKATRLPNYLNSEKYNGVYWCSEDGNVLLIRGKYQEDSSEVTKGFSIVVKNNGIWSYPTPIKIKNYDLLSRGIYSGATLSSDKKILIMYFSEEYNGEDNDLYVSRYIDSTDEFSTPIKLPMSEEYNDEISPYISPDGQTLYFSSNRDGGIGNFDIWYCKRLDDSWMKWSEPINLGKPFNTKSWDAYFSIGDNGTVGYNATSFKSSIPNNIGGTDIVYDSLPIGLRINIDSLKKSKSNNSNESYSESKKVETKVYHDTITINKVIPCDPLDTLKTEDLVKELSKGKILFDFGSSVLRAEAYKKLDIVATIMKRNPNFTVELKGHTDAIGNDKRNLKWSQDRADNAKNYLIAKGINPNRITAKGCANKEPVSTDNTDEGRQLNRRVDIHLIKE